jgi:hypothetical protein
MYRQNFNMVTSDEHGNNAQQQNDAKSDLPKSIGMRYELALIRLGLTGK